MEGTIRTTKPRGYKQKEIKSVYSPCEITENIILPITAIGKTLHQTIEDYIAKMVEGKCIVEGYVKPGSVKVKTYSSGLVKGENSKFTVLFNCEVCYPVAGMILSCVAKNITKAGIRAESADEQPSPFILFVYRDHFYSNDYFNSIEENEKFNARVIASRFELNDKFVSVIAEPIMKKEVQNKPKLTIEED